MADGTVAATRSFVFTMAASDRRPCLLLTRLYFSNGSILPSVLTRPRLPPPPASRLPPPTSRLPPRPAHHSKRSAMHRYIVTFRTVPSKFASCRISAGESFFRHMMAPMPQMFTTGSDEERDQMHMTVTYLIPFS